MEKIAEVKMTPAIFTREHLDRVLELRVEHREYLKSFQQMPWREGDETAPSTFAEFLYSKRLAILGDIFLLVQHGYFQDR